MPVSKIQQRMRGRWHAVLERASSYAEGIPHDGVSRGRFVADVLRDIDPRDCDEVVEMLGRRRVVWLRRYRGQVTVYGKRPSTLGDRELVGFRPIDAFLSDLAPLAYQALNAVNVEGADKFYAEAKEGVRVAVARILAICVRHASQGLPLNIMREAMWGLFAEALMHAVVFHEPRLGRRSEADHLMDAAERPKRLPNGLSDREKIVALIERGGFDGVTKLTLSRSIRPRLNASALNAILSELEAERLIISMSIRAYAVGRPGQRFFTAEIGLPVVGSDGTMNRRFAA